MAKTNLDKAFLQMASAFEFSCQARKLATDYTSTVSASTPSVPPSMSPSDLVSKLCKTHSRGWVETFLLFGVVLSVCMCFASRRRCTSTAWFRYPLWAAYLLIGSIVPYTLGLMSDQPPLLQSKLYPAWGLLFVAIANGLSGSISAFTLADNENGENLFFGHILLSCYMLGLFSGSSLSNTGLSVPFLMIFFPQIYVFQVKVLARSLSLQSKVGPCGIVAVLKKHREIFELELENRRDMVNPSSMTGYRYLVDPIKGEVENPVTVEKIWSCQRNVVQDEKRKDLCLSFALFWLLLQRYGGYTMHEASQDETWRLVGEKLLPGNDGEHERAFRVIEVELHFLYDLFYTTNCATYTLWHFWFRIIYKLWNVVLYIFIARELYGWFKELGDEAASAQFRIYGYSMDDIVTSILIGTLIALFLLDCCDDVTSIWTRVDLICYYVRKELWNNKIFEKMLDFILGINWRMHHHWERKLGQYSFLESYDYVPWWQPTAAFFVSLSFIDPKTILPRDGQSEGIRIELSEQVKKAIAKSIKKNGKSLSDGAQALRGHGFIVEGYQFKTTAEYILTWHIATDLASSSAPDRNPDEREAYEVALRLSRYCAYLVAFAPELLPDHPFITETNFDALVSSTKKNFAGCATKVTLETLKNITLSEGDVGGCILRRATNLAEMLVDPNRGDQRWNMLAEFWADLLVYLAPSDNAKAHAEHLATGGEFITHIWALLTHGGIITRKNAQVGAFGVSPDPSIVEQAAAVII